MMSSQNVRLLYGTRALLGLVVAVALAAPAVVSGTAGKDCATRTGAAEHQVLVLDTYQLNRLLRTKDVVLIDVRTPEEYDRAHLPGAVSVPLSELESRAKSLRESGKRVVVYCCSPSSKNSLQAAEKLHQLGLPRVEVLSGGFPQWVDAGFVVEVNPDTSSS